jgi:hypothetical protein
MKKTFILLTLLFLVCSCSDNDSGSNSQLFRNTYNNTSWIDADGFIYTFKPEKLFYVNDNTDSFFYQIGTYNNIEYDGCVYNTVNNTIASEDNDTFSIKQIASAGIGSSCPPSSVRFTFQVLDEDTIEVQTDYDGSLDSFIINKTNSVSTENSIDGTSSGLLW